MPFNNAKVAGTLLLVGASQFAIASTIAEAIYPGYSVSANYISDLGVWSKPSAVIFNPSIMLFGLFILASSYFIFKQFGMRPVTALLVSSGAGTLGVGIFPENTFIINGIPIIHGVAALLAFAGGALAAITAYKITKPPLRYISIILGLTSLTVLFLLVLTRDSGGLGLGVGALERIVVYPNLIWMIGFGGYLLGNSQWHAKAAATTENTTSGANTNGSTLNNAPTAKHKIVQTAKVKMAMVCVAFHEGFFGAILSKSV